MNTANPFFFSPITIGTMRLGKWGAQMNSKEIQAFVDQCLLLGLNDFDHADIYGDYTTEGDFGKILKASPSLRDKMKLITKCGIKYKCDNRPEFAIKSYDSGKEHIITSVENSLRSLETSYIDLLLLHRPDYLMSPLEIAETFDTLRSSGKVRAFGVSNFNTSQFDMLHSASPLVTNQIEVSALHLNAFENGTLDQCLKHKVRPMAWSPYGGGDLFKDSKEPKLLRIRSVAEKLALKYNVSQDKLLLAWLLKHPSNIIPVIGTSKIERVKAAKDALSISLTKEEWYEIWQASTGREVA